MPEESYTADLFRSGLDRIAQKVGEEAIEVVIASKNEALGPLVGEAADLLFHLMVLLEAKGSSLEAVIERLAVREER
jgi:phosphoribosyl-ATP pyrophosphohydrolase